MDKRVLVIAPHNDDEVLGAGGMIQRHLAEGYKVKVIIMTNGDGQLRPPGNRIKLGYRRQKETLAALKLLGLSDNDVIFLGYPDRGLAKLWIRFWEYDKLYISKYTKTDHSPYKNSYTPKTPYCGLAVVKDLKEIIRQAMPSLLYFPHPNDQHPDHWATNALVLYALEELKAEGKETELENIALRAYLVHLSKWPLPKGKHLHLPLHLPHKLSTLDTIWFKEELLPEEAHRKYEAILKYRSQTTFIKKYLLSFARRNELFGQVPNLKLEGEKWLNLQVCPFATKKRGSIDGLNLARNGDYLLIDVGIKHKINSRDIIVHIKPLGQSKVEKSESLKSLDFGLSTLDGSLRHVWQIPLKSLGHPQKIILGVGMQRNGAILKNSAYRLIELS